MKLLILRKFPSIGDMLMMLPALKEKAKTNVIDIAVSDNFKDLFFNLPYLNKVLNFDEIKLEDYDKVIDLSDYEFNYEQIYQPYITKTKIELFADALNVVVKDTDIDINLTKDELKWIEDYFHQNNLANGKRTILLAVKSANVTRDWSFDKWLDLISRLKKLNYNLVVVDRSLKWADPDIVFFNDKTLRQLFALVYMSDYVICHDSGLLHIAGAFKKKCLGIFGPTDPKLRCIYPNSYYICNNIGIEYSWYKRSKDAEYFNCISPSEVERKFIEVLQNEI